MELVEGVSLLDHLTSLAEKGRRMPEQDIWQGGAEVYWCQGVCAMTGGSVAGGPLGACATHEVVHRDLTPANIVLGQGPDGLRHSKIADFGLAKRLGGAGAPPGLQHSVVGTMPYTCPEIIQQ
ncbi:protein kinase domain-containing protein, partial [Haematococcus lacustris]